MIDSYLAKLKEIEGYDVKSVILFGSVARGQAKEHSDIDIILVASGLPELRNRDALPPFFKPARIQDIWMTPEELEDMVIAKTGFLVDALLEGRVLQDDGTVARAREKLGRIAEEAEGQEAQVGVDDSKGGTSRRDKL